MKYTILLSMVALLAFTGCGTTAGTQAPESAKVFEQEMQFEGVDEATLYNCVITWATHYFESPNTSITLVSHEASAISGDWRFKYQDGIYTKQGQQFFNIVCLDGVLFLRITKPSARVYGDALNGMYVPQRQFIPATSTKHLDIARKEWIEFSDKLFTGVALLLADKEL